MSQPQWIISGLKTNFKLSPSYSAHNSSNHKFSQIYKISPNTNYIKQNIHTQNQTISPFRLTLFKKKKKKEKRHTGIMDHSVKSIPDFFVSIFEKGMNRSNKKLKLLCIYALQQYKCHMQACCMYHQQCNFS